ncbi:hypothetical protein [Chitinibacter sp. GC72]|uniref:hypothetical protein n=1 Tax=Chitinibacter sp. GC72 TaxID=1526917 RepID=UPI0012F89CF1|nr:hypothetical protein [Chitinibacter sp. GC72]
MVDFDTENNATDGAKPRRNRKPPLDTVCRVKKEMAKLYRDARAGAVDVSDASKLANMLNVLARLIETSELVQRMEALEKAVKK